MANTVRFHDADVLDVSWSGGYFGHLSFHIDSFSGPYEEIDFPTAIPGVAGRVLVVYVAGDNADITGGFTFDSASPPGWVTYFGTYIDDAANWPDLKAFGSAPWEQIPDGVVVDVDPASDPGWSHFAPDIDTVTAVPVTTDCTVVVTGIGLSTVTAVECGGSTAEFNIISDTELQFGVPDVTTMTETRYNVEFTLTGHGSTTGHVVIHLDHDPFEQVDQVASIFPFAISGTDNQVSVYDPVSVGVHLQVGVQAAMGAIHQGSLSNPARGTLRVLALQHDSPASWTLGGTTLAGFWFAATSSITAYGIDTHHTEGYFVAFCHVDHFASVSSTTVLLTDVQGVSCAVDRYHSFDNSTFDGNVVATTLTAGPAPPVTVVLSDALCVAFAGAASAANHWASFDMTGPLFDGLHGTGAVSGLASSSGPAVTDAWRIDDTHVLILRGDDEIQVLNADTGAFSSSVPLGGSAAVTQATATDWYAVVTASGVYYLDHYQISGGVPTRISRVTLIGATIEFAPYGTPAGLGYTHDAGTGDPVLLYSNAAGEMSPIELAGRPGALLALGVPPAGVVHFDTGLFVTPAEVYAANVGTLTCTPFVAAFRIALAAVVGVRLWKDRG